MKLRNFLILIFLLVVLIPSLLFWAWPFSKALDSEIDEVHERHLVIANNLAMALERYYQDVTSAFKVMSFHLGTGTEREEINELLDVYDFQSIMLVANETGRVIDCVRRDDKPCARTIDEKTLSFAKEFLVDGVVKISPVVSDQSFKYNSMLLVVFPIRKNIAIGCLSTNYIVEMGKRVAFGKKGHAAILDQRGNVIAHPLLDWIKTHKSMAETSVVKKMMAGETGVETFISPAFFNEMIAGYTAVPGAGWGVMVPQPIAELHKKAEAIDRTALLVMMLGLGIALLIAIPVSIIITRPLERLSLVTRSIIEKENFDAHLDMSTPRLLPLEVRKLNDNFMEMMGRLRKSRESIARLAYTDMNTRLPNRNFFQKMVQQALLEMTEAHSFGALLFIDLDGFKEINDTSGHRAGDDLLSMFAKKMMIHFSLWDDTQDNDYFLNHKSFHDVILARLGGDEFVVLFKNITNRDEVKSRVEALQADVFGEYELYGNIKLSLKGSMGIAIFPEHGTSYQQLIKAADMAMYKAKSKGNGSLCFSETFADQH
ncbi:MAG: hypothetical protein DSY70_04125 [Desulfobulbus sp.]|nr:MAG: hypothetical protein DSY70_04125 [Desulfobulbus sp.]